MELHEIGPLHLAKKVGFCEILVSILYYACVIKCIWLKKKRKKLESHGIDDE